MEALPVRLELSRVKSSRIVVLSGLIAGTAAIAFAIAWATFIAFGLKIVVLPFVLEYLLALGIGCGSVMIATAVWVGRAYTVAAVGSRNSDTKSSRNSGTSLTSPGGDSP